MFFAWNSISLYATASNGSSLKLKALVCAAIQEFTTHKQKGKCHVDLHIKGINVFTHRQASPPPRPSRWERSRAWRWFRPCMAEASGRNSQASAPQKLVASNLTRARCSSLSTTLHQAAWNTHLKTSPTAPAFFSSFLLFSMLYVCLSVSVCVHLSICFHTHTHTNTHTRTHTHTHTRAHNTHTHCACVFGYVLSLSIRYKACRADFVRLRGLTMLEKQIWSFAPPFHRPPTTRPFFFSGPQPAGNGADHAHVMWAKRQNGFRPFTGVDGKKQ